MKLKIKENAKQVYLNSLGRFQPINNKWCKVLDFIQGKIVGVDTEYLLKNITSYISLRPKNTTLNTNKIEDELGVSTHTLDYSLNLIKDAMIAV